MKRLLLAASLVVLSCAGFVLAQGRAGMQGPPPATGPVADLANAGVEAINKGNAAYFESHLAPDVVWFDEDGHAIATKDRVLAFVKRNLLAGGKKVAITSLRVGNTSDAGWAGYQYTITAEGKPDRKGTQTVFYKKSGNDWLIQVVHGAVNAAGHM